MRGKETRFAVYRLLLAVAALIICAVLQNSRVLPAPFGARAFLLLCLPVCLSLFEGEYVCVFIGICAGLMWDFASVGNDGFYAVFIGVCSLVCSLLIKFFLRSHMLTAFCLVGVTALVHSIYSCSVATAGLGTAQWLAVYFRFSLPCAVYTVVWTPVFFLVLRAISSYFKVADGVTTLHPVHLKSGGERRA